MKKNLFMVAAVALMAFTACNKEEFNASVDAQAGTVEFVAGFDVDTKTTLDETKTKTLWAEDDKISINGFVFKVSELIDGGTSAKFVNDEDLEDFGAPFTACYPANVTEIPAEQDAVADNFDPKAVVEKAESDDYNLSFQNVASLLKFEVPTACQTVTLTSDDELAGAGSTTVTINGPFAPGSEYFAAVLPGEKANFTVNIDGAYSKSANSVFIKTSSIVNMGALPAPVVPEDAVIRINNLNGWGDLNITIKNGSTTLVNAEPMTKEEGNIFAYHLDNKYVGTDVTYYITHSWYQTSTKTVTLKADSEATAVTLNTTYLQPGTWDWTSATFGAWMWGTGVSDKMVTGVKVKDDFFEFEIPATGYNNVIFLRCNNSNAEASWDRVWNQTEDLTLKHMCFCVNSWTQSDLTDFRWY